MLIWAVWSDEEGRMACRNGLYYARPPDHCLYGTEKRAAGYLFPVLLSVFSLLIVFYLAKTICPYFFLLEVLNIQLYWNLLQWRSVLNQECERACSGAEQGIVL